MYISWTCFCNGLTHAPQRHIYISDTFILDIMRNQQHGLRTGLTQTKLYKHRKRLEAWNSGFRKKRNCAIRVAKTKAKALISFAVTAKLICAFVFAYAYAKCWVSHDAAHILSTTRAYLCVIAARHFLIDPHGIVKASMCGLFIYFNYPVNRL